MKKIIYLAAGHAVIDGYDITYQDIKVARDVQGDMMAVDLEPYDIIIATPPCNYYSSANWRRDTSEYSQKTKHLLPDIIKKLEKIEKPYIVENVRNRGLMKDIYPLATHVIYHGRHTYFTNVWFDPSDVPQIKDDIQNKSKKGRQGGYNVNIVIEHWLKTIGEML